MKRVIALILAVLFIAGSLACGAPKHTGEVYVDVPEDPRPSLVTAAPTAEPTGAAPSDPALTSEPSGLPSEEPSEAPEPTAEEPTEAPIPTEAPTGTPSDTPAPTSFITPTAAPTYSPTAAPSAAPSPAPTASPTPKPYATPKPSAAPTVKPSATPTVKPTATPRPIEGTGFSFSASPNLPLPNTGEDVPQGQPFTFGGMVYSDSPILEISAIIISSGGSTKKYSVSFSESDSKTSVELVDRTFPSSGDQSLTAKVRFQELPAGSYTFNLVGTNTKDENVLIASSSFKIVSSEWKQLISNNLRNNYAYALSFFGSRDEFMFEYKWKDSSGRDIELKGGKEAWRKAHMTNIASPSGGTWCVHNKAVSYYEAAIEYLKTTYVRVRGAGDSGVIKLWDLVSTFDGIWNPRFVTGRSFVSHHAFGTAIDLNASLDANRNSLSNRQLILTEVRDHLTYNGIKTADNGRQYYDFTYDGSHGTDGNNVPTTIVNYLLYELAFYRAGFNWGYYYDHTCDAMHFGLSEMPASIHDTSSRSLRKVYTYID